MINKELTEYVRIQRSNGLSKEAITQALAAGGWNTADVNEAFMAIDGVMVAPPPPPTPPPASVQPTPMQPRVVIPPAANTPPISITPMDGVTITPAAQRPVMSVSEFGSAPIQKKRSWLFPILLIVLFIALIGGGVFFLMTNPSFVNSYLESFFPPPTPVDTSLDNPQTPANTTSINPDSITATTSTSVQGSTTPVTGPNVFR